MKVIITEEQYQRVILNELGNRGKNLLSYIRHHYEVMGDSFTPRGEGGVKWYTKRDIINKLQHRFPTLPKRNAEEIVDHYLNTI
jgi:hypothetical protein